MNQIPLIPLKQYLQTLVTYNVRNKDICTIFEDITYFNHSFELIKRTSLFNKDTLLRFQFDIFQRYMNNKNWTWK